MSLFESDIPPRKKYTDKLMPFFHDFGLLFLHIPKNAGRSIEEALFGNPDAPHQGRRSMTNRFAHAMMMLTAPKGVQEKLVGTLDQVLVAQHLTYCEMELLGLLPKTSFTTFAVCRNPYDRVISSVNHFSGAHLPKTPTEFERLLIEWLDTEPRDHNERAHRRSQSSFLLDSRGSTVAGAVLRHENLNEDFSVFMRKLQCPSLKLPWHGRSCRSRDYKDYFTESAKQLVIAEYGEDIDRFEYGF